MGYLTPPSRTQIDKCHKDIDKLLDDTIEEFRRYEQMMQMRAKLMSAVQSKLKGNNGINYNPKT